MSEKPEQNLNVADSVLETVQIGGNAGRDLTLTQIQGGVGTVNVFNPLQVPPAPLNVAKSISQEEYRWRQVLLNKVKKFWVEGVLKKSLHMKVLIELGLEERGEFIPSPIEGVEEFSSDSRQSFAAGTDAAKIFQDIGAGRTLLILGEPGSGKTVTLLKLAESLVARTENDLSQPLPIVLNLSSWAKQRQTIAEWLVQEIKNIYGASKSLAKAWVEKQQLLLLLDGLDEVDGKYRNDCVKALNQFMESHGLTELVVCCRIRDYESLSERLQLRSAICVQPLTDAQIDQYLHQAGEQLSALQTLLKQNEEIRAFASSPLILSIMSLAYQGYSLEEISLGKTFQEHQKLLFDTYINRMFEAARKVSYTKKTIESEQKYPRKKTQRWLIWLAQRMVQESQTVFLIEGMQPSWLQTKGQKIWYRWESAIIGWLIVGLILGLNEGLIMGLVVGFNEGLNEGLIVGLIVGLVVGLVVGLIVAPIFWLLGNKNIETVETLKWSWKAAKKSSCSALIIGLMVGMIYGLITWLMLELTGELFRGLDGLIGGLIGGLIYGLIGGLIGGFKGQMQNKFKPNQGIWRSAHSGLIMGLIVVTITVLIFCLIAELDGGLDGLISSLIFCLIAGLIAGFVAGGSACLRHFSLRLMLYCLGYIPWNYARFLDYAAERLFLQKVGGGYIFVHRMLLEHFASMSNE